MKNISVIFFVFFHLSISSDAYSTTNTACGAFGFKCFSGNKVRLCDKGFYYGPTFVCPGNTICNDYSTKVCEDSSTYVDPSFIKSGLITCRRNDRIPDPSVPDCKGYVLCIQRKKSEHELVKFKCAGTTVFNPSSRTCSSPQRYTCTEKFGTTPPTLYEEEQAKFIGGNNDETPFKTREEYGIDCKHYKFSVDSESGSQNKVAYFCPKIPTVYGTKCTVFSNNLCVILQKEEESFFQSRRSPRLNDNSILNTYLKKF